MLRNYSPRKHHFVGIGRSPVEVTAFLKNLSREIVTQQMPLTGLQGGFSRLAPKEQRTFFRHVEKFIPKRVLEGSQDIVLVDIVGSGGTIRTVQKYLQSYLRSKGSSIRVKAFGLSRIPQSESWKDVEIFNAHTFGENPVRYTRRVALYSQEHWLFGSLAKDNDPLVANPQHAVFRRELFQHMRRDAKLDRALTGEFGNLLSR